MKQTRNALEIQSRQSILALLALATFALLPMSCKARKNDDERASKVKDAVTVSSGKVYTFFKFGSNVILRSCKQFSPIKTTSDIEFSCPETESLENINGANELISNQRLIPANVFANALREEFNTESIKSILRAQPEFDGKSLQELDENKKLTFQRLTAQVQEKVDALAAFGEDAGPDQAKELQQLQIDLAKSKLSVTLLDSFDQIVNDSVKVIFDNSQLFTYKKSAGNTNLIIAMLEDLFLKTPLTNANVQNIDQTKTSLKCQPTKADGTQENIIVGTNPQGQLITVSKPFPTLLACRAAINNSRNGIVCLPSGNIGLLNKILANKNDMAERGTIDLAKFCLKSTRYSTPKRTCIKSESAGIFIVDVKSGSESQYTPVNPDVDDLSKLADCIESLKGN